MGGDDTVAAASLWQLFKFESTYCGPPVPPIVYYGFRAKPIRAMFTDRIQVHTNPPSLLIGRLYLFGVIHSGFAREREGRGYFNGRQ